MSLQDVVERIRKAEEVKITPKGDKVVIEIKTTAGWVAVIKDLERSMAEDIIRQANNRVILG